MICGVMKWINLDSQVRVSVEATLKVWVQSLAVALVDPLKQTFFQNVVCYKFAEESNI